MAESSNYLESFSTHLRDWKTSHWTRSSSSTCSSLCPPINKCTWLISSAVLLVHTAVNVKVIGYIPGSGHICQR